jgi:chromosome segregation ATPase
VRVSDPVDKDRIAKLKTQIADLKAAKGAEGDQVKAAIRDRDNARRALAQRDLQFASALAEAKNYEAEVNRVHDKLEAMEQRVHELRSDRDELAAARSETRSQAAEAAATSEMVRKAEMRADQAEQRAARAEREMVEQAAAVTGEQRKLTPAERKELIAKGPSGPAVMAKALQELALARKGRGDMSVALTKIATSALTWRDRL